MKKLKHIGIVLGALFVILGIPALYYAESSGFFPGKTDTVSRASFEIPDAPSGEYVIFLNSKKHGDTAEKWAVFFSGGDSGVIMEDVSCLALKGDAGGIKLAERYKARLAENQMRLKTESSLVLAGKAEHGLFDVIVLSKEAEEILKLKEVYENRNVCLIYTEGDGRK